MAGVYEVTVNTVNVKTYISFAVPAADEIEAVNKVLERYFPNLKLANNETLTITVKWRYAL